jgi:pimeloyl-ACP methyl ester carboxylesterase
MITRDRLLLCVLLAFAAILAGCAARAPAPTEANAAAVSPAKDSVLRSVAIDRTLEDRILALDPTNISDADFAATLSKAPAPHIVLIHGGIFPTHLLMASAGRFLVGMGYPEDKIRHPSDRSWSYSPYESSAQIAGVLAWHYEHDGMRPMMIGHSQGGIQAVKVLYELAGRYNSAVAVWDPHSEEPLPRTTIMDPVTGVERPVVGLTLSYVSVVGAGGAALLLPNQWSMVGKVHTIPDTVVEFTGFSVGMDSMAWSLPGATEFRHNGTAAVRSVALPSVYNHLTVPVVGPLLDDVATRAWISAYAPDRAASEPPAAAQAAGYATLWAADVWYSVKKHWTLEAQRLIRARRAALGSP